MDEQRIYEDKRYPAGVRFILRAEEDDLEVRGNALASGDDAEDRKVEDEIIARLDQGDVWAWASVCVLARIDYQGNMYEGRDYLGACSYEDADAFTQPGGYWDDMKAEAYADLRKAVQDAIESGEKAKALLRRLPESI